MPHHRFNGAAFVNCWSELTGAERAETKQRIRMLRLAGMLPDARLERQNDLSDVQIAIIILALMCSDTHLHAPGITRRYANLRRSVNSSEHRENPFDNFTLLESLTDLVRRARDPDDKWRLMFLQVCDSQPYLEIACVDSRQGKAAFLLEYGDRILDNNSGVHRISTLHHLPGEVIIGLAQEKSKSQAQHSIINYL